MARSMAHAGIGVGELEIFAIFIVQNFGFGKGAVFDVVETGVLFAGLGFGAAALGAIGAGRAGAAFAGHSLFHVTIFE